MQYHIYEFAVLIYMQGAKEDNVVKRWVKGGEGVREVRG